MHYDPIELESSVCRDSLWQFVRRFWPTVIPENLIYNWHMEALCNVLQEAAERVFQGERRRHDLVVNIPPGTSKSSIVSVFFPAWCWIRMPSCKTICTSYSYHLAMDLSRKSRDVVQSDKWIRLFGDIQLREDQNTKGYFANAHGGSRYAVGTNGTVTGFHGHFLIIDDPIDPHGVISKPVLDTANRFTTETLATRKIDKAITVTILVMQRLHQSDPAAEMLKRGKTGGGDVWHINLPAEILEGREEDVRPQDYLSHYQDGLLDPARLPREVLKQMEINMGPFAYAGQMLQTPVPRGGGMFSTEKIEIVDPPVRFKRRIRYWDKAGSKDTGAYTVGALIGLDMTGRYWILDVVRGQWEVHAREAKILQTAQADGADVEIGVEQEPGSGGKDSMTLTIQNLAGFRVKADRPTGDKILRAEPFAGQVNGGNVYMAPGLWNRFYLDELQYFPHSATKDQVDASSGGFNLLTKIRTRVGGLCLR